MNPLSRRSPLAFLAVLVLAAPGLRGPKHRDRRTYRPNNYGNTRILSSRIWRLTPKATRRESRRHHQGRGSNKAISNPETVPVTARFSLDDINRVGTSVSQVLDGVEFYQKDMEAANKCWRRRRRFDGSESSGGGVYFKPRVGGEPRDDGPGPVFRGFGRHRMGFGEEDALKLNDLSGALSCVNRASNLRAAARQEIQGRSRQRQRTDRSRPEERLRFRPARPRRGGMGDRDAMMSDLSRAAELDPRFAASLTAMLRVVNRLKNNGLTQSLLNAGGGRPYEGTPPPRIRIISPSPTSRPYLSTPISGHSSMRSTIPPNPKDRPQRPARPNPAVAG